MRICLGRSWHVPLWRTLCLRPIIRPVRGDESGPIVEHCLEYGTNTPERWVKRGQPAEIGVLQIPSMGIKEVELLGPEAGKPVAVIIGFEAGERVRGPVDEREVLWREGIERVWGLVGTREEAAVSWVPMGV